MTATPVSAYAPTGTETDKCLQYPFTRPAGSFLTDGEAVQILPSDGGEFREEANEYLRNVGLPLLHERQPVVAYGSNGNPARLAEKMSAFSDSARPRPRELQVVPNLSAVIADTSVVWHGKPGQGGSAFAELYKGVETTGQNTRCHIAFLTPQQLALMHLTEGPTYHLTSVLAHSENGERLRAAAYVASSSTILLKGGLPVGVKRPGEADAGLSMTADEAVNYMLINSGDEAHSARELVAQMASLYLPERKARQQRISERLGALGISKRFRYPCAERGFMGRADLSITPGVYHVAEQLLESLRPTDPMDWQTERDIALWIRRYAHDELAASQDNR